LQPVPTFKKEKSLAKPNYDFAKRQRELNKAQKKEAKRLKKQVGTDVPGEDGAAAVQPPLVDEKPPAG